MNELSERENRCIRIGRMYALLSTLLEYKHGRSDSIVGLRDIEWDSRIARRVVQALMLAIALPILAFLSWVSGILTNRRLLRVCAHLDSSNEKLLRPAEKTLEALWNAHGPSEERLHSCSLDDRADCLCLWLDVLYGEGTAARLRVRARVRESLYAEGQTMNDAAGIGAKICFGDPLSVLIRELSAELPTYDRVADERESI